MSWFSDFLGTSTIKTPGLGTNERKVYGTITKGATLSDKQVDRATEWLQDYLKNNRDPSAAAFELSKLGSQYPGVPQFEPGSKTWGKVMDAQNAPISIKDADYLSTTMLGRSLTGKEKKYVRREDPSSYKFAGLLAANPRATLADFPTEEENKVSAYYGRMIPKKGGFTGERFSSIAPVEYTGGIG